MKNDGGDHCVDFSKLEEQGALGNLAKGVGGSSNNGDQRVVAIVITNDESGNQFTSCGQSHDLGLVPKISDSRLSHFKISGSGTVQKNGDLSSTKKSSLSRSESFHEQCRICQQQAEETLIDLGCQCRGGLAKAHRSCIDTWFRTKGSNKCEICQQVAVNVSSPESQPSRNYWVWRVDPSFSGPVAAPEHERGCYSPLWVAFSILIGGLILDVLISISLGVSALPMNIIIGVLVVLGLGTALRLALECFHELSLRRAVQSMDRNASLGPLGYHPAV